MNYDKNDFLETADHDTLEQISRARELTRKYFFLIIMIRKIGRPFFGNCWEA